MQKNMINAKNMKSSMVETLKKKVMYCVLINKQIKLKL